MNRQLRRHKTHPALPIQYPSDKRIIDKENPKTSAAKGGYSKKRKKT